MPSGLKRIMPRVRVSTDALRIPLLVAMGVTAGYFWRAAFEAGPLSHPVAPGAVMGGALPAKPPVRIVVPLTPRRSSVRPRHIVRRSPVTVIARPQLAAAGSGTPSVRPSPPTKPTPRPTPPSSPPPPTPSPPSPPAGGSPSPSTPSTPSSPAAPPAQNPGASAPPAVVSQPTPATQPPTSTGTKGERPGVGNGDKNHD